LRVRAVAGANLGPPSNEIRVFVNVPPPPSAPANLLGLIHGDRAFLSWTPTAYGGAATAFQINVTGNVTDSFVISGPTETFAVSGVPPGNYAVSVVALNPQGVSPPSPTIALQVPSPCAAPQAPTNVQVMQIERVLSVLWDPPVAGSAITHYAVRVSGAAQGVLQTIARAVSQEVSPGRYTVRVTAVNSCGVGVSSPERTVIVP
jgi:predicted phage tail protein